LQSLFAVHSLGDMREIRPLRRSCRRSCFPLLSIHLGAALTPPVVMVVVCSSSLRCDSRKINRVTFINVPVGFVRVSSTFFDFRFIHDSTNVQFCQRRSRPVQFYHKNQQRLLSILALNSSWLSYCYRRYHTRRQDTNSISD
jgi:hypothetical protein